MCSGTSSGFRKPGFVCGVEGNGVCCVRVQGREVDGVSGVALRGRVPLGFGSAGRLRVVGATQWDAKPE